MCIRDSILILDDEEIVSATVSQMIQVFGGASEIAADGHWALDYLESNSHSVDVFLLDWTMPVMSGRDVLIQLRQNHPSLPVIVMSGFTFACDEWTADDPMRPDAVLQKPFRIDELCEIIDTVASVDDGMKQKILSE